MKKLWKGFPEIVLLSTLKDGRKLGKLAMERRPTLGTWRSW